MNWVAGLSIPDNRRLTLIRNADRLKLVRLHARLRQSFGHHTQTNVPDLFRVVFNPTRLWIGLCELRVSTAHDYAVVRKDECCTSGRALIERENSVRHAACSTEAP